MADIKCFQEITIVSNTNGDHTAYLQLDPDDELEVQDLGCVLDADRAARPVAAQRVSCACHTLQLVVQDGLPAAVARQVGRVNAFVASVKRSTTAAEVMTDLTIRISNAISFWREIHMNSMRTNP